MNGAEGSDNQHSDQHRDKARVETESDFISGKQKKSYEKIGHTPKEIHDGWRGPDSMRRGEWRREGQSL